MDVINNTGDKGITSLVHTKNVSKSDDRIGLIGALEELSGHIGLIKSKENSIETVRVLEKIQAVLMTISEGISDPYNKDYRISDEKTEFLEEEIKIIEGQLTPSKEIVFAGKNEISSIVDIARAVARRAERMLSAVSVKYGSDNGAKKYMNRLGDYLYSLARLKETGAATPAIVHDSASAFDKEPERHENIAPEALIVEKVLNCIGATGRISLKSAKVLIEKIETEALKRGKNAVIAVCGPDGNPIAVHVMDGAFLVSFDAAMKKAYSSVAVKMSTMELQALAQPGCMFYGVDKLDGGKITIIGGGVPLKIGDTVIGGLGISGGTGDEDHSLAEYGLSVLNEVL